MYLYLCVCLCLHIPAESEAKVMGIFMRSLSLLRGRTCRFVFLSNVRTARNERGKVSIVIPWLQMID